MISQVFWLLEFCDFPEPTPGSPALSWDEWSHLMGKVALGSNGQGGALPVDPRSKKAAPGWRSCTECVLECLCQRRVTSEI